MYTFNTPDPVRVGLRGGAGLVTISAEPVQTTTVEVVAEDTSDESEQAAESTEVEHHRDTVEINAPRGRRSLFGPPARVRVTVVVPESSSVFAKTDAANIRLNGPFARVVAASGSGDVSVERTTDKLDVRTGSGRIWVDLMAAGGSLASGSGDVTVNHADGATRCRSGSGDIHVGRLEGELRAKSGSGDVRVASAVSGRIDAGTGSGDVSAAIGEETAVWLDLNTVTGDVNNALDVVEQPEESDSRVELKARTSTGDITIRRS